MVGGQRLGVEHVRRVPDATPLAHDGVGVDDRTARDVDDERALGERLEERVVDQPDGRLCQRHRDDHDVGAGQQVGELVRAVDVAVLVVARAGPDAQHVGAEAGEARQQLTTDATDAEQHDGPVDEPWPPPRLPPCGGLVAHEVVDLARRREHERHRQLRGRRLVHADRVRDDAALRQHVDDPVVPERLGLDDADARHVVRDERRDVQDVRPKDEIEPPLRLRHIALPHDELDVVVGEVGERLDPRRVGHGDAQVRGVCVLSHDEVLSWATFVVSQHDATGRRGGSGPENDEAPHGMP